jgi:hypothetical protein
LLRIVAALLCAALAGAAAPSWGAGECSCKDRRDLLNRLREANAAIRAYEAEIPKMEAREAQSGKPVMYTKEVYEGELQPRIQDAINRVTTPEPTGQGAGRAVATARCSCPR